MLLKIILMAFSLSFLLGASSCKNDSINAYQCVLIAVDEEGQTRPVNDWYWFCKNQMTADIKEIPIEESVNCIRDNGKLCKWYGTDVLEFDRVKKALGKK